MAQEKVKERPILFTGEMVRAILEGRKTVTRRVMKPQPPEWVTEWGYTFFTPEGHISGRGWTESDGSGEVFVKCRYGSPGDLLYVRENIYQASNGSTTPHGEWKSYWIEDKALIKYEATDEPVIAGWYDKPYRHCLSKRPSIHMPKWASRLWLRVKDVRVERVQDITAIDAVKEGIEKANRPINRNTIEILGNHSSTGQAAINEFAALWDSINAKRGYSWESNPFVWVVEFEKVETYPETPERLIKEALIET